MPSWLLNWRTDFQKIVTLMPGAALAGTLIACSTHPQGAPVDAPAAQYVERPEQCSTVGVMACKAMALLSSDTVPTCGVSTARDGRRTEVCGYVPAHPKSPEPSPAAPKAEPSPAARKAYPVHVSWADNSDNESNFVIERCDQVRIAPKGEKTAGSCIGRWQSIATVGANTTSYVDNTAAANTTYLYRIRATNSAGSSAYTQETAITTPAQ
jgi:hypothetical protein